MGFNRPVNDPSAGNSALLSAAQKAGMIKLSSPATAIQSEVPIAASAAAPEPKKSSTAPATILGQQRALATPNTSKKTLLGT